MTTAQRGSAVDVLEARKEQVEGELAKLEKQIYALENDYLQADYCQCGTVLKGFEGFLSSKDALRKRNRVFKTEDRVFSLSSRTSPAAAELDQQLLESMPEASRGKGSFAAKGVAVKGRRGS